MTPQVATKMQLLRPVEMANRTSACEDYTASQLAAALSFEAPVARYV
jgi:hypothetical protein